MESSRKVFLSAGVMGALGWLASDVLAFTRKRTTEVVAVAGPDNPSAQIEIAPAMPDLTVELAQLMDFTGKIALAIRKQTVDAPRADGQPVSTDLGEHMWLIECLGHFSGLGQAIRRGAAHEIVSRCDDMLGAYRDFRLVDTLHQRLAKAAPDTGRFSLNHAMTVLSAIRAKVMPLTHPI